jgi:hypothetical protein
MNKVEKARKSLIEHALNEIRNIPSYSNYYIHIYSVIVKLGLQRKAKIERLFKNAEWHNLDYKDVLFDRIKIFD